MRNLLLLGTTLLSLTLFAQEKKELLQLQEDQKLEKQGGDLTDKAAAIVAEGKLLYKIEMASSIGTDLFRERYRGTENIGGYFSYVEGDVSKCIYYSKKYNPKVIGTITMDSTFNPVNAKLDFAERNFTPYESSMFLLRMSALKLINQDVFFKEPARMHLNISPLIDGDTRKVYIMTTTEDNIILIGNDYVLNYDEKNNLISKKLIHPTTTPFNLASGEENELMTEHVHYPENGNFITATDVCTLLLYEKYTKWKIHRVISQNSLNIWNCETNNLVVFSKAKLDEIARLEEEAKKLEKKKEKELRKGKKQKDDDDKDTDVAKLAAL